jgi:hypothetical protein
MLFVVQLLQLNFKKEHAHSVLVAIDSNIILAECVRSITFGVERFQV